MKKFLSAIFASVFVFSAVACTVDLDDLGDGIIHVPPSIRNIETTVFSPTEASDLNKERFVELFRATKSELSDEEFTQKYTAFYNYMPIEYANDYNADAFEVKQSDGDSIFYVRVGKNLYRIDPFATDTDADFNGFVHFSISDLNKDGCAELLVSYYYEGTRLNMAEVHAIDLQSGSTVEFDGYYRSPIFFEKTEQGIGLYKGAENNPNSVKELVCEVTKNIRKYVFHKTQFSVQATDYKAEVEIEEGTINFPIIAEDLSLQFTSRVTMTWLGEDFEYLNNTTGLDGAYARYSNGTHTLECAPWAEGDAETYFYIANGRIIETEYYMLRVDELDCLGDYNATLSYRFSEEKPVEEKIFSIVER